ncbi:MAG TPA: hypothetical protein VJY33_00615 [Isosphaeraceae bacterium]|nr:hypothetical protein [Isosphaeraceae bacterium]
MGRLRSIALEPRLLAVMVAAYVSQASASDNDENGSRSRSG